ncbi:unnamed protein product [Amoebophrya sp. A25]|nr:unnamed protein product [Amoebophrya sp. A25]|eukprot:GSA25T00008135001.1
MNGTSILRRKTASLSQETVAVVETPVGGNLSLVIYFARAVEILKLKVTLGPPEFEISRVISEKDVTAVSNIFDKEDPRFRGSGTHRSAAGNITKGPKPDALEGKRRTFQKPTHLTNAEDVIASAFRDEVDETHPRRNDPLDMCKDDGISPDAAENISGPDRPCEIRLPNFGMIQRLWCRRSDSIPIRVEVLECAARKNWKKRVRAPGMNYGNHERFQTYDQFLSPNFLGHQVNGWITQIKYKHLRKATWDVTHVQDLCRLVPSGHCIESNIFRIAGLDSVRLVLYPNGLDDLPMQCALYLRSASPENDSVTVRAILSMNAVSKTFQGPLGKSLGRTKFCSLQNVNKLRISIEIEECVSEALHLHTAKRFEKLEDTYRLPETGGVSLYPTTGDGTLPTLSRPTTTSGDGSRPQTSSNAGGGGMGQPLVTLPE